MSDLRAATASNAADVCATGKRGSGNGASGSSWSPAVRARRGVEAAAYCDFIDGALRSGRPPPPPPLVAPPPAKGAKPTSTSLG